MTTDVRDSDCPGMLDLSEFVDGVERTDVASHLGTCGACRQVVEHFRQLDEVVRQGTAPPAGLADRIKETVAGSQQEHQPLPFTPWWQAPTLRLAAAFAVTVAALAVLVFSLGRDGRSDSQIVVDREAEISPHPGTEAAVTQPVPAQTDLAKVGAMKSTDYDTAADSRGRARSIAPRVRHVWSVNDIESCTRQLKDLFPKGSYSYSLENGNPSFAVTMKDTKLQELVNDLAEQKWELMSDSAPQPNRPAEMRDATVHYHLVLAAQND